MGEKSRAVRRDPRQGRSKFLVDAILSAASSLVVKASWSNVTTNKIAKLAGVSIGSLYQYFPNKDALVSAIVDRHVTTILETMQQSLGQSQSKDLRTLIRDILQALMDAHRINPALHRVLKEEISQPASMSGIQAFEQTVLHMVEETINERKGELRSLDAKAASFILSYAVEAVIRGCILSNKWMDRSELILDELEHMVFAYIQ